MSLHKENFVTTALNRSRTAFTHAGVFSCFVNILMLTVPIYMLQIFDRVLASFSYDTLLYLSIIGLVALGVLALLDMTRSRILIKVSLWLDRKLAPEAVVKSADEILKGRSYGAQAVRDVTQIRQFLASPGIFSLFDSPWVPIYLLVIFLLHPLLGIFATVGALALFILAIINEMATKKLLNQANAESIGSQRNLDLSLRNAEAIQAMGMMPNVVKHWEQNNSKVLEYQGLASERSSMVTSLSKFLRLGLQLLMLGIGAMLVIQNQLTPGGMIAGSILLTRALAPVEQAIGVWRQWISVRASYARLKEHFTSEDDRTTGIQLPAPEGHLGVEHISYFIGNKEQGEEKPVIEDIHFVIHPGELVGIVGPTGAGKSTLARLVVGAYKPSEGVVRLDGADVYSWDRADFGKYVGYLPQDVELFPLSIKENICRLGDVDDEAVIEAAQLAGVHEMILRMPMGYETDLANVKVSGGQRQRIALARALYKKPCLIVLDEPNASLDHEGEQALATALSAMKQQGSSILVISHRPSIISIADKLIVVNKGKLQMGGERDAVLAQLKEHMGHLKSKAQGGAV